MAAHMPIRMSRRCFLNEAGLLAGAAVVTSTGSAPAAEVGRPNAANWPRRVLGRTNLTVTCMTLGSAVCEFPLRSL